jgi:hypothetical protein
LSASWVAAATRGRGLASHLLGRFAAEQLSRSPSLGAAIEALSRTPYRREVQAGMEIAAAEHAVGAAGLWQLRVLAGWSPAFGAGSLRVLAGKFEIANIVGHLSALRGNEPAVPFTVGGLGTTWPSIASSRSTAQVRAALARSPWGDPGADDPAAVRVALELAWARQLAGTAGATGWAAAYSALVAARLLASGALRSLAESPRRDLRRLLGDRAEAATSITGLAGQLPRAATWVLAGLEEPDDLWTAETRWWRRVADDAVALSHSPQPCAESVLGCGMLVVADAQWVQAALEIADRGGGSLSEVIDAVA